MEAKIEKISELSKLLSVKTRMSDDLFHLFGKFGIGHLLSRLSLEKQDGVSASELLLSLCLFRIVGESIHSICKHKIYELSNHGKNCFYRMMIRPQMDWRRLMNHFALRYMCLLRKYGEVPQSDTTTCFIIDDTVLEKSGVRMEGISRVFDHMKGRCVLGYKLLLCAFFDSKTGEQIFESHYIDGKKEGEEWEIFEDGRTLRSRTTRHYRNGKLDGFYRVESTRDGKPYITIEGQYTDGEKSGRWKQYNATDDTTHEWDE